MCPNTVRKISARNFRRAISPPLSRGSLDVFGAEDLPVIPIHNYPTQKGRKKLGTKKVKLSNTRMNHRLHTWKVANSPSAKRRSFVKTGTTDDQGMFAPGGINMALRVCGSMAVCDAGISSCVFARSPGFPAARSHPLTSLRSPLARDVRHYNKTTLRQACNVNPIWPRIWNQLTRQHHNVAGTTEICTRIEIPLAIHILDPPITSERSLNDA